MGYAKYVGRVGGLAVALGVGVAVATTPGVAWADPTDSGSTSSSSGTSEDSTASGTTGSESSTEVSGADDAGSTVDAGDGTAGEDESTGSDSREGTEKSTGSTIKGKKSGSDFSASTPKAPKRAVVSSPATSDVSKSEPVADSGVAVQPKSEPVAPPTVRDVSVVEVTSVTTAKASLETPPVVSEPEPVETPLESTLLSAVGLAPSADGDVPELPGESPLTLVALAALRRQTQQSLIEDEAATPVYQLDSSIPIGSGPTGLAVTPDGGHVYVADRFTKSVHVVDTSTGAVETIYLGAGPNHVAFHPDGSRAYVGLHGINQVAVIDTATKKVVASVKVGPGATETVVTPDGNFAYVTNTSGRTVSVIDTETNTEIARVTVGSSPMGLAVTPDGSKVYVANRYSNSVSVIDVATNKVISTVKVGSSPRSVAITDPDGPGGLPAYAYVTNAGPNTVSVIDTATNKVVKTITVGTDPIGVATSPDGAFVYAANSNDTVSVIDTTTKTRVGTFSVDPRPETGVHYIAVGPDGTVYVTDTRDKMLRVVTATSSAAEVSTLSAQEDTEPMMLAVAAVANSAPTVPVQPTGIPDPATGLVSGNVVANDGDGDPLTYSVTGTSANGGKVSINSTTGAYTYTPTAAARLAAGTTTGADTDSFTVSVFDGQTTTTGTVPVYVSPTQLTTGTPISVGNQPAGVAVYENAQDPTKNRTYVINQYDKTVSVIDSNPNSATFNKVVGTIKVASTPSDIVVNSTGTRAYVTMKGNASVAVIDTAAMKVIDVNPSTSTVDSIRVGSTPTGIAISEDNSRLYVTNGGSSTVSVIDTATNKEISRITVGSQPSGIAYFEDPNGQKKLFVTLRYADSLAIVNLADNTKTLVRVGDSPREVALNSDGTRAYVTNYDGTVSVVDTAAKTQLAKIVTGGPKYQPAGVAIDADRGLIYVANGKDTVSVIDAKTNTLVQNITIDSAPESGVHHVALSADGTRIYVTDFNDDNLRTLSLSRGNTAPLSTGSYTVGTPNVYTGAVSGLVNIQDPDGDPLTHEFVTQRGGTVTYDAATDTYTYTPTQAARYQASYDPSLTDNITVYATDPSGAQKVAIITVPISGNFNPATGVTTGTVNVAGNNTYSVTSSPTYGSLVLDPATGNYTYTSYLPNDGYNALWYDSFSWEATDGQSTQTGTVTVDTYVDPYILYGYMW